MGYIKKLKNNELVGGTDKHTIYPVTSTKAVFEEVTEGNESSFKTQETINGEHDDRIKGLENEMPDTIKSITINGGTKKHTVDDEGNVDLTIYTVEGDPEMPTIADNVARLNEIVGTDSTSEDTLLNRVGELETLVGGDEEGSVNQRITNAINELTEEYSDMDPTDHIQYQMVQSSGKITELTIQGVDIASANALEALRQTYEGLTRTDIIIQDTAPTTGNEGVVYRVTGDTTYTDYMFYNGQRYTMATYDIGNLDPQVSYYTCTTPAATTAKAATGTDASAYALTLGGHFKVEMDHANTATSGVTLQVGSATAKELMYNGATVTPDNTWEDEEVIAVYYYNNKYWATNAQGGGGKAEKIKYDNSQSWFASNNVQGALDEVASDVEGITQEEMKVGWVSDYQDGNTLRTNAAVIHAFGSAAEGEIIVRASADYRIHSIYVYASTTYNVPVSSSTSHYEKFNPYGKRFVVNVKRMDGGNITTAEGSNVEIIANNGVIPFVKKSYEEVVDCVWLQGFQNQTYTTNAKLIHTLPIMANGRTTIECTDDYFIHSVFAYDGDGYNILSTTSQYMEFELVGKPFVVNIKRNDSADMSPSEGSNVVIKTENTMLDKRDVFSDAILMGGILSNNGSIATTSHNIYLLPFISIDGAVNARIIYKGKYLSAGSRYYGENGNYLGKNYTSDARYWRCTADLGEDTDIDAVSENTVILVNGKTISNNNGVLYAGNIRYYDGVDFNNTLQQVIDSIPLAYRNKTLFPEDFEGSTIEDKIANMDDFLVAAGGHFNIYFGKTLQTYTINKAIILPSNTTVIIDGCKVKLNTEIHDNVFRTSNIVENVTNKYDYGSVSGVCNNIHIIGMNDAVIEGVDEFYEGVVHGPASSPSSAEGTTQTFNSQWYGWHGNLIYLQSVDGFSVSGVKLTKNCGWCTNFAGCYNGEIHDIDIDSRASNGDGIDVLAGSHDIKVWNIWNHSQDDTVALGTGGVDRIANNFEYLPSFVLPPDSNDYLNKSPIYNIEISHVHSTSDIAHNVCLVAWTDIQIHHVYISDVAGFNGNGASDYNIVFWGNHWHTGYTDGNYHHIFANNIDATYAKGVIRFEGMPHDSWFNNIKAGTDTTDPYYINISGINPAEVNTHLTNMQE